MHDSVVIEKDRSGGGALVRMECYENTRELAGEQGLTFAAFALKILYMANLVSRLAPGTGL
jgi:hypothetical protein